MLTVSSFCYILSDKYSITSYSTTNGYKDVIHPMGAIGYSCSIRLVPTYVHNPVRSDFRENVTTINKLWLLLKVFRRSAPLAVISMQKNPKEAVCKM